MNRNTLALIVLTTAFATGAGAATYKWVDKDGKVHYSDKPVEGAERVELKPLTEVSIEPVASAGASRSAEVASEPAAVEYSAMSIASPKPDETLRGAGIGVSFVVDLQPALAPGDRIEYELDGQVVERSIDYVERGTHTVTARVLGPDGAVKISADPVTFHVHQNIADQPAKPKPKKP